MLTGASAPFFRSLLQLLGSLERWDYRQCRCYDLGLTPSQREILQNLFPWVEVRQWEPCGPAHLVDVGNYGWKPTVLDQAMQEQSRSTLWLDSACVVTGSLRPVEEHLARAGVWVPWAGRGPVSEMTHPQVMRALDFPASLRDGRFRAGGVCAFTPRGREILERWRELAWQPELLAPAGATRHNHRFDQVLLTYLLADPRWDPSAHEIDISSARPVSFLRTRNKVDNRVPYWLDPLVRAWFWLRRLVDVTLWQMR